jgi:hypothetical protein
MSFEEKICNLITCFNRERREQNKGMKRIKGRRRRGEERNYSPLKLNGLSYLFIIISSK